MVGSQGVDLPGCSRAGARYPDLRVSGPTLPCVTSLFALLCNVGYMAL